MSVPNQTPYIIYNANGLTTVFPFEFYIINAADLQVSINGTTVTSGYSVSGTGNVGGGDVTFITPPASGSVVMLERVVPTYRLTDYQDNGDLLADTVNKDFDRLWMAIQRSFIYLGLALRRPLLGGPFNAEGYRIANLGDPVDSQDAVTKKYLENNTLVRTLRVPEAYVEQLPAAPLRANKLLAFDNSGRPIVVLPESGSASDVMIQLASNDGEKYIGECPTIAVLRTIEPTYDKQRITLREHTAGTRLGGGQFRAVLSGSSYTDNNGTIIKTAGGAAWLRINADVTNPLMFGALGDGVTNDVVAINRAIASASKTDLLGRTYLISGGNFEVYNTGRSEVYNGTITEPAVNNNVMMRISGSKKIVRDITFLGDTGLISRGIIVSAGASNVLIQRCTFMNMKKPAIGISGDYTNNIYCKDITVDSIYAENCGNDATNFDRNTILFDGVSSCTVINSTLNNCNWGVSFRQPYTYPSLTERYANYNSVINCRISGKGFTGNPYPENQGISSQSQRHFKVTGCIIESFSGNAVDHQRCDYGRFENNRISGSSDGLFFGDLTFRGHIVTGNTFSSCVRALRVYSVPDFKNQTMTGLVFSDNLITDCSYYGIYLSSTEPTNTFSGFSIKNNVVDNAGSVSLSTFQNPILIEGVTTSDVSGNVVRYARKEGIRFNNCNTIAAYGNTVSFFDTSVTTQPGIYIDVNSRGIMLRNSIVTTSSGTGAAVRNVSTNSTITGTRWNGVTSGINDTGVATVVADNLAF